MTDWWSDAPLATESPKATVSAAGNWWDAAPLADGSISPETGARRVVINTNEIGKKKTGEDQGVLAAATRGAANGFTANFYDELKGLSAAGGSQDEQPSSFDGTKREGIDHVIMGLAKYWFGDKDAEAKYNEVVGQERQKTKDAESQHPIASTLGNVAGALAIPAGPIAQAATLPARVAAGAGLGAAFGGLSGVGEGDGAVDRVSRGAAGAAVGGAIGGAAPAVIEGAIRGGRALAQPIANAVRGVRAPEDEAARRVALSIQRDIGADPTAVSRLTPSEFAGSVQSGGPATIMDIGGETTRALARSAANTSPEGRAALSRTIDDRFEGQGSRVTDWLNDTFHYPNADAQAQALTDVAKTVNNPAYHKAYAQGRAGIWDNELSELSQAPVVKDAVDAALKQAQNKSASGKLDDSTISRWANGGKPTLELWDLVTRQLGQEINVAKRVGRTEDVATLTEVKNVIMKKLDDAVPSFAEARAGAAHFFGAQDALEAGQKFVNSNVRSADARRALAKMSPTERQLFQDGFVSNFIETLGKVGDRRSVLNKIAETPAAREKLHIALGPQKAAELEAGLRVEGIMDLARGAVQGNSTTARQLAELGLAGGAYGVSGGGLNPFTDPAAVVNAALVFGAAKGKGKINENVSRKVAEMLTSSDPTKLLKGIKVVSQNQTLFNSLRSADKSLAKIGGGQSGGVPALQAAGISRADDQPNIPRPPGQ